MKNSIPRVVVLTCSSLLGLACTPEDLGQIEFGPKPLFDPIVMPTSSTGSPVIPLPFDGLYGTDATQGDETPTPTDVDDNLDGTLNLAGLLGAASLGGAGQVDGWSTSAPLFTDLVGQVDVARAGDGIRIYDTTRFQELQPGTDFIVEASPVVFGRTRLLVHWLKPLPESTRFLVALTRDLRSPNGGPALINEVFALLASETPVSQQNSSILASLQLAGRTADIAVLERLQSSLIGPVIDGLIGLSAAAPNSRGAIARSDIVLAWSFTTQSITPGIETLAANAAAQSIGVQDSGLNLSQALSSDPAQPVPLQVDADVYAGFVQLPYYLSDAPNQINSTFWVNDGALNDSVQHPGLNAPCGALLRPTSTTICYPTPAQRSVQTVPVLLTRPQLPAPPEGWPVVIFMHGITGNRSQMFGIAPALSRAGFVVIAIDHPLHGVAENSPLRVPGTTERTFDADLDGDGIADPSGSYFINLSVALGTRDNGRQAVIDQIHLIRSLGNVRLGDNFTEMLDTSRIRVVGHSLGGLIGTGVLAFNDDVGAATLAMPGGGIAKLLDGSDTFGPRTAAGLEQLAGIVKGTDSYENFMILAQTAFDAGDPINLAAAAASSHPIHLIEVVGDTVVPNNVINNPQAVQNGYLSGTDPLSATMGLTTINIDAPVTTPSIVQGSHRVLFSSGNHGSILLPTTPNPLDDPVFVEMQNQTVQFLASDGACLPLGTNCPQ